MSESYESNSGDVPTETDQECFDRLLKEAQDLIAEQSTDLALLEENMKGLFPFPGQAAETNEILTDLLRIMDEGTIPRLNEILGK